MKYTWTWKETGKQVTLAENTLAVASMKIAGSFNTEEETALAMEGQASVRDGGVYENNLYKLEGINEDE